MNTSKPTDIKKYVIYGRNLKYGAVPLYVNDSGGEMWATNKYWATRAERVAPLLEKFNLSADAPGAYAVDGNVKRSDDQVPMLAQMVGTVDRYSIAGVRASVGGVPAYTLDHSGSPMALYTLEDGDVVGIPAGELGWLSEMWTAPLPDGFRYGETRVRFRHGKEDNIMAAVVAEVIRIVTPHAYGTDPETRAQVSIPAVEEPAEPRILGIIMARKYGSS